LSGNVPMKYLLVLLVVGVGLWFLSARLRAGSKNSRDGEGPKAGERPSTGAGRPSGEAVSQMVTCSHCGVHLPADEAVYADERPYCGAAHLQAGPGKSR